MTKKISLLSLQCSVSLTEATILQKTKNKTRPPMGPASGEASHPFCLEEATSSTYIYTKKKEKRETS